MNDPDRAVLMIKRLWDETAIRVQLSELDLLRVVGEKVGEEAVRLRQQRQQRQQKKGKGCLFPGYTLQMMQQLAHIRWGSLPEEAGEVILPAKIISGTGTVPMYNGLVLSAPMWSPEALSEAASHLRCLILRFIPDGLAANRLVMAHLAQQIEEACVMESHCLSHLLQVSWEAGCREHLLPQLFGFTRLMASGGSCAKVCLAIMALANTTPVVACVAPPPDGGFNEIILRHTIKRDLYANSYFRDPDGSRYDEASEAEKASELGAACQEVTEGLNAPWYGNRCHFCWHPVAASRRCCINNAAAIVKVKTSCEVVGRHTLSSLKTLAKSKWRSLTFTLSKVALPLLVHELLPQAFANSLGTAAELRKAREDVRKALEAAVGVDEVSSTAAYRLLRGKRTVNCSEFFADDETTFWDLGMLITALPIDTSHQTIWESESYAKSNHRNEEGATEVGLIQALVDPLGLLDRVHSHLASNLIAGNADFAHLARMARAQNLDPSKCADDLRGMALRLSASLKGRFVNLFHNDLGDPLEIHSHGAESSFKGPWDLFRMLGASMEQQSGIVGRAIAPDGCPQCRGLFIVRLAARLLAPPILTLPQQVSICHMVCRGLAEDPFIVSMYGCELLHAQARQSVQASLTRRKKTPLNVFSKQVLVLVFICRASKNEQSQT